MFVSGSTRTLRGLLPHHAANLGFLTTPKNRNSVRAIEALGIPWAIDNGAYSGFDADAFRRLVDSARGAERLAWVVCPDVVGDARATLAAWRKWRDELRGLPLAFVGQDGMEELTLPRSVVCFFIGGTTAWKLSAAAADLTREAKRRGWTVHMGRVNSLRRMRHARLIGCDSFDGSSMSRYGDKYMPTFLRWIAREASQSLLFGGS